MTRVGFVLFETILLVPIHQTRSVKRIKVFESRTNTYLTQVRFPVAAEKGCGVPHPLNVHIKLVLVAWWSTKMENI
uniref:Secreted protein n=1 Tax=Anguilla anguilla TaxID=7936 RepID=A0A0E9S622_ANGAN